MTDEEFRAKAIGFAKREGNRIAREFTDPAVYAPSGVAISVFMAGSPGAGKTEFSKNLISILEEDKDRRVIRIDGDEFRSSIPGYTGNNSHIVQGAISLIVEKLHDHVLHRGQIFILDGTFAKYERAIKNIDRSLEKKRPVFIFYLYQKPEVAWKFTKAREKEEGRNVSKPVFIELFLGARDTINRIRDEFGKEVIVFLVKKDFEKNTVEKLVIIEPGQSIDDYLEHHYTKDELEKLL